MKVLMVRDSFPNGGAERQLALLAANLPSDVEVRVAGLGGGPFLPVLRELGVRVDVAPRRARFDPSPAAAVWRLAQSWRPDVVHTWGWMSAAAVLPAAAARRTPIVDGTIRNAWVNRRYELPRRAGFAAARLIVANSRAGLAAWGVTPRKGRVVYNGVDPERLRRIDAVRAEGGGPRSGDAGAARPFTVVMTGRMTPAKDFVSFIAAARLAAGAGREPWRFVAVGSGPDRPLLERAAADLVAAGRLTFVDAGLEVLDTLLAADVGVLLTNAVTHAEGCSNSLLEYMACRLPVVCSDSGGDREVIADGETGFVVPPGEPQAVVARLGMLAADPDLRRRQGAAGRRRVETRFTLAQLVDGWLRVYAEALGRPVPGAGRADVL